jgi:hypothetical protein
VSGVGDEAVAVTTSDTKAEWIVARKGSLVVGVGDEELVKEPASHVVKDDKIAKLKALLATPRGA